MRTNQDPNALIPSVLAKLHTLDPSQPAYDVRSLSRMFGNALAGLRFVSVLMGVSGLLALVLATMGVYSVMAHTVSERRFEIGVRIAMGATPPDVVWMVLGRAIKITAIALLLGGFLALAVARGLSSLFIGVSPWDPVTFLGGAFVLTAAGFIASVVPARRATQVNPISTLRPD